MSYVEQLFDFVVQFFNQALTVLAIIKVIKTKIRFCFGLTFTSFCLE